MSKQTYGLGLLCAGSLLLLAGCGGSSDGTPDSNPIIDHGTLGTYYFVGNTNASGRELWKSDGSDAGTSMVKEINPLGDSNSRNFTQAGSTMFFTADDRVNGIELWKSDANGVAMVKDIHPSGNSNPRNLVASSSGIVYFNADDDVSGGQLWKSDGTDAGTVNTGIISASNVSPMDDGSLFYNVGSAALWHYDGTNAPVNITPTGVSGFAHLTPVGTTLYFMATDATNGTELWKSDGTVAGTVLVSDIEPGTASGLHSSYSRLFNVNDQLVFTKNNLTSATNPFFWTSDGTAAGTVAIEVGTPTPAPVQAYYYYTTQAGKGNHVYFFVSNALWRTDGTVAGTHLVTNQMSQTSSLSARQAANGTTFLNYQSRLWVTDGTDAGTNQLSNDYVYYRYRDYWVVAGNHAYYRLWNGSNYELMATDGSATPAAIYDLQNYPQLYEGDRLYMSLYDSQYGTEPWASDGTTAGTTLLADINTQPSSGSYPYNPVVFNGSLYFLANDGVPGLWKSDGSEAGTVRITPELEEVYDLTISGNKMYFAAEDKEHGYELWVSDGTTAGTNIVVDLAPGTLDSYPYALTDVNGTLFFSNDDFGGLWKSNGTVASTLPVALVWPSSEMKAVGDKLYFTAYDGNEGNELWVSDGTLSGTHIVKEINPTGDSIRYPYLRNTDSIGDTFYFIANDGANGYELWKTDGTEAGTQAVLNMNAAEDGVSRYSTMKAVGNTLYFTGYTANADVEVWKTDGSEAGTSQVSDLAQAGGSIDTYQEFAVLNGFVYFQANNGTDGREPWRSDGTTAGTTMLKDINTFGSSYPYAFYTINNTMYFIADDGDIDYELWKTDGTEAGTVLVKDVYVGEGNGASCLFPASCSDEGGFGDEK